ncbi:MAG: amidophosphoribosyltransferase [Gammaproteobacteria bacterium]
MCGVIGCASTDMASPVLAAGLSFLQHRGQDAAGIATLSGSRLLIEKGYGVAGEVFDKAKIAALKGGSGVGHVRYATRGDARALSEMQPFYVNQPYGMALVHNGNLTNYRELCERMFLGARRHINGASDSEALLNVLAHAISERGGAGESPSPQMLFDAVADVHKTCRGAYSAVVLIAGAGLLAFRDPMGIRPLALASDERHNYLVASESAAFRPLGFRMLGDIAPGEAVFIDNRRQLHRRQCAENAARRPCVFEYIYLARPDSVLDGVPVYDARLNMGRLLAETIRREHNDLHIDCVVPVPDSGRVAAMELAHVLDKPYREALVKNRYSGRSFIAAGQASRQRKVREKLNVIEREVGGRNILLVDDSIVRGTTAKELVALAFGAGARRVYVASAAPPVRYPNVYGIDIATRRELLASGGDDKQIAARLGADRVIYQKPDNLASAVCGINPDLHSLETSCFDGDYPTGDIDDNYLRRLEAERGDDIDDYRQMDLIAGGKQAHAFEPAPE